MQSKAVLVVGLVVALAAIWFLGGSEWFDRDGGARDQDGERDPGGTLAGDPLSDTDDSAAKATKRPVLFGSEKAQRIGVGSLLGRVMDFASKKPVKAASLLLVGTGYGDETVTVRSATTADGYFRLPEVAAGEGYTLRVRSDPFARAVPSVAVSANAIGQLGTIWLGEQGVLQGIVRGEDGAPVANARVEVHPGRVSLQEMMSNFADLLANLDRDPKPLHKAETETNGRFRIANVAPGPITVLARVPGHRVAASATTMTSDGSVGGPVEIVIQRAGAVAGQVVDEAGVGLAGARVALMEQSDFEHGWYRRQFSETDAGGLFRIDSVPGTGKLVAIVAAEGYPTLIEEAAAGRGDLYYQLKRGATVTVRLLDKDTQERIVGAQLVAFVGETQTLAGNKGNLVTGVSDAHGELEFVSKVGFLQMLMFTHPQYGSGIYGPSMPLGANPMMVEGPKEATIKPGANLFVLRKQAGVLITGVVTGEGRPVAGARVTMPSGMGMAGAAAVLTDAEGRYEIPGLPGGQNAILVQAPGFVQDPKTMQIAGEGENGVLRHDIALERAAVVSGKITNAKGTPLAGVQVKVSSGTGRFPDQAAMMGLFLQQDTMTANDGTYVLEGIAPGEDYHVLGRCPGYVVTRGDPFRVGSAGLVKAPTLKMRGGRMLRVQVLDARGSPHAGARVEVSLEREDDVQWDFMSAFQGFANLFTDDDGNAVVRDVPAGIATLTANAKGFAGARKTLPVPAGAEAELETTIRLRPGFTLSGAVLDSEGAPVAGASVAVSGGGPQALATPGEAVAPAPAQGEDDWVPMLTATADARGRFEIEDLPDAELTLVIRATGFQRKTLPVRGRADGLEIRLAKADPDVARRITELQQEIAGIWQRVGAAKDDAERQALQREAMQLSQELQRLQAEGGG